MNNFSIHMHVWAFNENWLNTCDENTQDYTIHKEIIQSEQLTWKWWMHVIYNLKKKELPF